MPHVLVRVVAAVAYDDLPFAQRELHGLLLDDPHRMTLVLLKRMATTAQRDGVCDELTSAAGMARLAQRTSFVVVHVLDLGNLGRVIEDELEAR